MALVKRYRPGAFPQFTQADDNLRAYLRDEFNRIALLVNELGEVVEDTRENPGVDITYYVRADGNDNHDGLSDTADGAFLTIQRGIDALEGLDLSEIIATVQVGAGTYNDGVTLSAPLLGGSARLIGDTSTPFNVEIAVFSGDAIKLDNGAVLEIAGFKLSSAAGNGLLVDNGAIAQITDAMEYGACNLAAIQAHNSGRVYIDGDFTMSGSDANNLLLADVDGGLVLGAVTITLSGTPTFSITAHSTVRSFIYLDAAAFSGAANGMRYRVHDVAAITTAGRGPNFIPGNVAGIVSAGGQYQ